MKTFVIILFAVCFTTCISSTKEISSEGLEIIKINLESKKLIHTKDLFDSIDIVNLETLDQCMIGHIGSIKIFDGNFYIHDATSKAILCFNRDGEFIFKLHKVGRGEGEYTNITKFEIDSSNKEIAIYDGFERSLILYDIFGNYKNKIYMNYWADSFTIIDKDTYCFYVNYHPNKHSNNSNYNLIFINREGKVVREMLKKNKDITKKNVIRLSQHYDDQNNLLQVFNDTIFSVTKSKISPKYYIDFQIESRKYCYNNFINNTHWLEMIENCYLVSGFNELNDVICFYFGIENNQSVVAFYSKKTENAILALLSEEKIMLNNHNNIPISPNFYTFENGLMNVVEKSNIENIELLGIENSSMPIYLENPIILMCYFKMF